MIGNTPILKKVPIFSMNGSDISSAVIALQNFEMIIALIKDGPEIMEKSLVGMLDWRETGPVQSAVPVVPGNLHLLLLVSLILRMI